MVAWLKLNEIRSVIKTGNLINRSWLKVQGSILERWPRKFLQWDILHRLWKFNTSTNTLQKSLRWANGLAYYPRVSVTKKKSFITLTSARRQSPGWLFAISSFSRQGGRWPKTPSGLHIIIVSMEKRCYLRVCWHIFYTHS